MALASALRTPLILPLISFACLCSGKVRYKSRSMSFSARHNDQAELQLIKRRYQELEKSYNELLELVRRKNVEHDRLK